MRDSAESEPMKTTSRRGSPGRGTPGRCVLVGAGAVIFTCILWQTAHWTRIFELRRIRAAARDALSVYVGDLQSELDKFEALPLILAQNPLFVALLSHPDQRRMATRVNIELERINRLAETSAIYILDRGGLTIASSNWRGPISFVGEDLSFRPYFQQAMQGRPGRYFALGTTSKVRGYYFSAPIRSGERIVGVITVKVQLHRLENIWSQGSEKVVVTDHYGVIFITSYAPWKFCSLWPLDPEIAEALRRSRRYGDIQPRPITSTVHHGNAGDAEVINLEGSMLPNSDRVRQAHSSRHPFLLQSHDMPDAGWTVHILSDISHVKTQVRNMVLLAGSLIVTLLLGGLLLHHRRRARQERDVLERRSRKALEEANRMLEQRVSERTAELTDINQRLRQEIRERQHTESELRAAQQGLVQAGKLAAIGQMAAGISHEINQPLAAIRMFADNALVFLDRAAVHDVRANLQDIVELVGKIAEITDHLKSFARKSPGRPTAVPVGQVIENAVVLLDNQIRKIAARIDYRLPPTDTMVLGDPIRLEQVLVNVIRNSLDAVASRSRREVRIRVRVGPEQVTVVVHDSGPGIAEKHMHRLFDAFFTRRKDGKGLGLGLSLSLAIVKDFGGTIIPSNDTGGGAVMSIVLRRVQVNQEKAQ